MNGLMNAGSPAAETRRSEQRESGKATPAEVGGNIEEVASEHAPKKNNSYLTPSLQALYRRRSVPRDPTDDEPLLPRSRGPEEHAPWIRREAPYAPYAQCTQCRTRYVVLLIPEDNGLGSAF